MTIQINLIALRARDPKALAKFYEAFGLRFEVEQHGNGLEHLACTLDGSVLEIYPLRPGELGTASIRLGFRTASIDSVVTKIVAAKGVILNATKDTTHGRRAVVQDPEGHKIELLESA